jgi:MoaA/NifB/PqqE/SkfB family radical SAM enzyme
VTNYYTPGAPLDGRCLYPFLYARVSFSGKAYFCPFIRVEVGDLTKQSLEEVWTGERYVALRKKLVEEQLFPVCRRCCKVELAAEPAMATENLVADAELSAIGAN